MNRKHYIIIAFVLTVQLICLSFTSVGHAADCKALYEQIRIERTLMKKKQMVADAVKVCPNDASIVYQYGYSMERFRKYEEALEQYKKAVKIDPTYTKAYFSVGDIQMLLRNYREAALAYQVGLQYEADNDRAKISLKEAKAKYKEATGKDVPAPPPLKKKVVEKKPVASPAKPAVTPVVAKKPAVTAPVVAKKPAAKPKEPAPATVHAEAPIIRLHVPFFKKDTNLSQDARDVLAVVVGQAMNRPDMNDVKFEIGGYTDNIGDSGKNIEISKARAEAVKDYLVKNFGISSDRLIVVAHGQKSPVAPNSSSEKQELNRRVEFKKIN